MGGAGGSLRAGVTTNPVKLTRSVKDALTYVSCGGAQAYVWPGGGITVMVDVTQDARPMPSAMCRRPRWSRQSNSPCAREDYAALGGYLDRIQPVDSVLAPGIRSVAAHERDPDPTDKRNYRWGQTARQRK